MPDCFSLARYRTCYGIVSFFQSGTGLTSTGLTGTGLTGTGLTGTGLTGCRTVRHSGISTYMYIDIDMDMKH
jgi:hypothetical protein